MKYLKIFFLINFLLIFSSCGSVKDAFSNRMKNSSDEFLVEKKSPLVMPPEYNQLPVPNENNNESQSSNSKIKKLISNEDNVNNSNTNAPAKDGLENSIIKKIKTN